MVEHCGGCGPSIASLRCKNAFARLGILKVHWECWSTCNLKCRFCYRMKGRHLSSEEAESLVRIIRSSGARWITFAGGDPSLRPGINSLIYLSKALGLKVEVQTNAHSIPEQFREVLMHEVDQVGLSLDGPTSEIHDRFRSCPGNFAKVTEMLEYLRQWNVSTVVRTVVSSINCEHVPAIADCLAGHSNITMWSLMQFSALNDGAASREQYDQPSSAFQTTVEKARERAAEKISVDAFCNSQKSGSYALVSPAGNLYGIEFKGRALKQRIVGSMLADHLCDLSRGLPFDRLRHHFRYG